MYKNFAMEVLKLSAGIIVAGLVVRGVSMAASKLLGSGAAAVLPPPSA